MMEKPILFNTEMVRAILEGRKTVTRRVVKLLENRNPQWSGYIPDGAVLYGSNNIPAAKSPYRPGDVLWVRETWSQKGDDFLYRAWPGKGQEPEKQDKAMRGLGLKWHPSIHMPREAARIFLRVTGVRVERLQEITMQDIRRECSVPSCAMCSFNEAKSAHGIKCRKAIERSADCALENLFPDCGFRGLWDSTIKPADRERYGWAANPFCWVIEFECTERPVSVE